MTNKTNFNVSATFLNRFGLEDVKLVGRGLKFYELNHVVEADNEKEAVELVERINKETHGERAGQLYGAYASASN